MEFKVEKKVQFPEKKYSDKDIDIAYKFTKKIHKEFGTFLRATVLFGSTATPGHKDGGDIDILLLVDDVVYLLSPEIVEAYRVIVEKTIAETSTDLHVTTLKFTSFWEYIKIGDPVAINMLRDGVALLDTGFFYPLQLLLHQGRIRPTREAVMTYFQRAPTTLFNAKWHILQATVDLYWACIDAAHSALMKQKEMPPAPKEIAAVMQEKLVAKGLINKKYVKSMDKFYKLSKLILHRERKEMSGKEFDALYLEARDFVEAMRKIVDAK